MVVHRRLAQLSAQLKTVKVGGVSPSPKASSMIAPDLNEDGIAVTWMVGERARWMSTFSSLFLYFVLLVVIPFKSP